MSTRAAEPHELADSPIYRFADEKSLHSAKLSIVCSTKEKENTNLHQTPNPAID